MNTGLWDSDVERADPAGEAAEIAARLSTQLAYVAATSPFYRALWETAGVDSTRIRTVEEEKKA